MDEFWNALWTTLVTYAGIVVVVLFIAYLIAACSYPFWMDKR